MTKKEANAKLAGLKKQKKVKKSGSNSDHSAMIKKIKAAVAAGELTRDEAKAKLAAMKKKSGDK